MDIYNATKDEEHDKTPAEKKYDNETKEKPKEKPLQQKQRQLSFDEEVHNQI